MRTPLPWLALLLPLAAHAAPAAAKNVVTINMTQIVGTIDPAKISDYTAYMAAVNLYDGLVGVDPKGNLVPHLADRWEGTDDAKSFTFHLKDGAKFQSGKPVTAADVVWSVQRLLKINQGPSSLYKGVLAPEGVSAVDDRTVRFDLLKTYSPFLATVPVLMVVEKAVGEANAKGDDLAQDWLGSHTAGAGPYKLETYDRSSKVIVSRFEGYHMGWQPGAVDEVRMLVTNDEATVRALAASGELTMTSQYQSSETYDALAKGGRFQVVAKPSFTQFYLKLNTQKAPTDDVHVRKAIACATDYDTIRASILPGGETPGPLSPLFADYMVAGAKPPKLDLDCAKREIAASKYAGQKIPLEVAYVANTKFEEEVGLLMKATMETVGIDVTLRPEPWNRMQDLATKPETTPNANQVFLGPTYPSPDAVFFNQYNSTAKGTWLSMEWLNDPAVDQLINAGRSTAKKDEQVQIYRDLQKKIIDLQPDVFLLTQIVRHAMDKCLTGFDPVPMQSFAYNFSLYKWSCAANG